jgi:hypothetical protein
VALRSSVGNIDPGEQFSTPPPIGILRGRGERECNHWSLRDTVNPTYHLVFTLQRATRTSPLSSPASVSRSLGLNGSGARVANQQARRTTSKVNNYPLDRGYILWKRSSITVSDEYPHGLLSLESDQRGGRCVRRAAAGDFRPRGNQGPQGPLGLRSSLRLSEARWCVEDRQHAPQLHPHGSADA